MSDALGYDGRCRQCHQPFTFFNSQGSGAVDWNRYCCKTCEQRAEPVPGLSRAAFDAYADSHGLSSRYNARESAWDAWREGARRAAMKEQGQ